VRQIGGPMNRCPSCDELLDMDDEQPLGTLWDFPMGRIVCHSCGAEIGVIHPTEQQPQPVD
jgi:hypothetical protein